MSNRKSMILQNQTPDHEDERLVEPKVRLQGEHLLIFVLLMFLAYGLGRYVLPRIIFQYRVQRSERQMRYLANQIEYYRWKYPERAAQYDRGFRHAKAADTVGIRTYRSANEFAK